MQEMQVLSLGWQDPLKKVMTTYSSILAWRISCTEEPGRLQSIGSQRVNTTEQLSTHKPRTHPTPPEPVLQSGCQLLCPGLWKQRLFSCPSLSFPLPDTVSCCLVRKKTNHFGNVMSERGAFKIIFNLILVSVSSWVIPKKSSPSANKAALNLYLILNLLPVRLYFFFEVYRYFVESLQIQQCDSHLMRFR